MNEDCNPNLPFNQYVVFIILETISGLLALIGNALVLFAIAKTPSLRSISNLYIVSLALADISVGLFMPPIYIGLTTIHKWVNSSHPLYIAENFLWVQTLVATTLSLCAVTIDRYLAVTWVFRYREMITKTKSIIVIVIVWIISFIFASTSLMISNAEQASILWVSCLVFTVILPGFVITYCYFHILKAAKRQLRIIRTSNNIYNTQEALRNHKSAITIGIVIGTFVIMFTPNFIFSWVELGTKDPCEKMRVYRYWLWAILVVFANSAINPWIYALRMEEFKRAFRRMLVNRDNSIMPDINVYARSFTVEHASGLTVLQRNGQKY